MHSVGAAAAGGWAIRQDGETLLPVLFTSDDHSVAAMVEDKSQTLTLKRKKKDAELSRV